MPLRCPRKLLLLLCVLAALVAAAPVASSPHAGKGTCAVGSDWGSARADLAGPVVSLVNQYRAGLGLSQLKLSPTLTNAAVWKARHMAKYNYFAHDDPAPPVARSPFERMQACGYSAMYAGENIAYGFRTPGTVMQAWIDSPGHRANLQSRQWTVIGVGVAQNQTGVPYWVQDFGATDDSGRGASLAAHDDSRLLRRNHKMWIQVLKNDAGDRVKISRIATAPRHGRVAIYWGRTIVYRPGRGFIGWDDFRYEIKDANGVTSTARVRVRVVRSR